VEAKYQKFLVKYVLPNAVFAPPKSSLEASRDAAKDGRPHMRKAFQPHPALSQFFNFNAHYDIPQRKVMFDFRCHFRAFVHL
jgi:hypothetical protein